MDRQTDVRTDFPCVLQDIDVLLNFGFSCVLSLIAFEFFENFLFTPEKVLQNAFSV